ncbi:MAG: gamma-glutamyl-gamma-aminobutyrate hydrolase family protein [Nevskia sp.]|nr:gamma-glutamyl-gamma-aminobutyrate hydrolase family protein [Nevskia sp.]
MQNRSANGRGAGLRLPLLALAILSTGAVANAPTTPRDVQALPGTHLVTLDDPVQDGHVTSPYGWRVHPILKRRRFHKGVDFGAPQGTPVHAAADGVIEAIEARHDGFCLGVQWHPEKLDAASSRAIFAAFIRAAKNNGETAPSPREG